MQVFARGRTPQKTATHSGVYLSVRFEDKYLQRWSLESPANYPDRREAQEGRVKMIISADDIQAEHDAAMASLTPAQHRAIARLRNAKQATHFQGGHQSDALKTLFRARSRTAHPSDRPNRPAAPSSLMTATRLTALAAGLVASTALISQVRAAEVYGGVFAHDVNLGVTRCCNETGADIQLGLRGDPIVSPSTSGATSAFMGKAR